MARVKLSEFRAKSLLHEQLGIPYHGFEFDSKTDVSGLSKNKKYVVKVDEGVKKRFKQGLVKLDVGSNDIKSAIKELEDRGYSKFLVEEFQPHDKENEKYLAFERVREGISVYYSDKGGIDIEENSSYLHKFLYKDPKDFADLLKRFSIKEEKFLKFIDFFENYYFSFLEINPLVIANEKIQILDIASEVDSAADFFIKGWRPSDFREHGKLKTIEEKEVIKLAENSQASLTLTVLDPNGSIFMLLSGGGASIVLADEAYNHGKGSEIANYGEYSGNPSTEETYLYTKNILSLLFKSSSKRKALIIGGGVANFTDIHKTFQGVIQALEELADALRSHKVKIFVRRGGPNQEKGLAVMGKFLEKENLFGSVYGPEVILTKPIKEALSYIENK